MTAQPLVTVILPVFNAGPFVGAALGSICRQDYGRLEILVIDDGSTDDSLKQLERIAERDRRVVLVSRENRGLTATLNEGLALASGKLIARMDADDVAYPTRISRQVEAFASIPELGMCGARFDLLRRGRIWRTRREPIFETGDLRVLSRFFALFMHSTTMFDRVRLGSTLHYDARYPHAEDFELFRRIAARFPVHLIPQPLLAYRMHDESVSGRHRLQMQHTHLRIVAENLQEDGFIGDIAALPALALCADEASAARVGDVVRELSAEARGRAAAATYQAGLSNLVVFLMNVLLERATPDAASLFLSRADGWRCIRRRERLLLRLTSGIPPLALLGMKASDRFQRVLDRPRSYPAARLMAESQLS